MKVAGGGGGSPYGPSKKKSISLVNFWNLVGWPMTTTITSSGRQKVVLQGSEGGRWSHHGGV